MTTRRQQWQRGQWLRGSLTCHPSCAINLTGGRFAAVRRPDSCERLEQARRIAAEALTNKVPTVFVFREYAEAGGLMSYGADLVDNFRRAATYADKIIKGAKPAELPFEQPTRYYLEINRKTATAL